MQLRFAWNGFEQITLKFCTCHDNSVLLTRANFHGDCVLSTMRFLWNYFSLNGNTEIIDTVGCCKLSGVCWENFGENWSRYNSTHIVFATGTWPRVPDSKIHGANMGATWVLSAPGGTHVGPMSLASRGHSYPNGPEASREASWGSEFVLLKKRKVGSFILLHKISWTACCFGIRTFLKQYSCYESATIWYTDHQYLAQCSEMINNLPEIPLIFCNYAVRSFGTWRKGPGQSPCNVLSISDLELYVTETSTGVCDSVTDWNVVRMRKPL